MKKDNQNINRYRVKSLIKSFRDLEVYQKTIQLSNELTSLEFLKNEQVEIKNITEAIPKLIAEAYGDRYDSEELAYKKLSEAMTLITNIITKIDLFREKFLSEKEVLDKILTHYIYQRRKILNLRNAWERVFDNEKTKTPNNLGIFHDRR